MQNKNNTTELRNGSTPSDSYKVAGAQCLPRCLSGVIAIVFIPLVSRILSENPCRSTIFTGGCFTPSYQSKLQEFSNLRQSGDLGATETAG